MHKGINLTVERDRFRARLLKYTRRAFRLLPKLTRPRILDVGCGSGVPTMELAKLSRGEVVALDIDEALLEELDRKLIAEGLSSCVTTKKGSMLNIDFPDESFDLIWAEGSISFIGFARGLREWKRLLRPGGFLVVHTETKRVTGELGKLSSCGYRLFAQFALPEAAHWTEYYRPLEIRVNRLLAQGNGNLEARRLLRKLQKEIDMVKRNPRRYSSAFYILRRL